MDIYIVYCYEGIKCVLKRVFMRLDDAHTFIDKSKKEKKFTRMYLQIQTR